ncbi:NADH-quinone oxidoreductase subunit NuoG [bacterium]|nr:NADH-quinone oxidoreductase subunit NuoG [bacterium]
MPKIFINNNEIEFQEGMTVLQACELAGVEIPRFCYHERLSIAGNCRMCLVEMEKSAKPIASCAMPAAEGMKIKTNTKMVEKARKGVMEFLLVNHPLDCPVCDQGGECDLQDQSLYYGFDGSRFKENKRLVKDKYMGPLIKTQMTRCIHCTRCIRFATEVAGVSELGAIGRGEDMEITTYLEKSMTSELSGNVIDLCPVGALTSKPYAFEARPWELKKTESIDVMDAVGSNIRVDSYGWEVKRILPRINNQINEEWISDKTRYACDGLLKQRLDKVYIRKNNQLVESSWDDAISLISSKIKSTRSEKIAGHVGGLSSFETINSFKKFLEEINVKNYEFREKDFYVNPDQKMNYIFNSSIQGIEKADFILLVGANPRHEATILNARIRKTYLKNKLPIFSIGNPGDLTYPYKIVGNKTEDIQKIFDGKSEINDLLKKSKNPLIIIGESALELKSGKYIFEGFKEFLYKNKFINEDWNSFNILTQNAATVGALDLNFFNKPNGNGSFFDKMNNHNFDLLYLVGSDELNFQKNNEFIIYQGSHGDRMAQIADVILPSPAYTEQNGFFINLEGRLQKAFKATNPIGNAKEDWKIFNLIVDKIKNKNLFTNYKTLIEDSLSKIKENKNIDTLPQPQIKKINLTSGNFYSEQVLIRPIDYYFSNPVARASKTMSDCRIEKIRNSENRKTG